MSSPHDQEELEPQSATDAIGDLEAYLDAPTPQGDVPPEFMEAATKIIAEAMPGTQFPITIAIALAGLLLQLYTYFKNKKTARALVARAAKHPHGLVAQVLGMKVKPKLPKELNDQPVVTAVIQFLDAGLTAAGV
jgi:hypothetical protein